MEESNPWPTFVDAFSTVLCIFIFLMLIFVLNSMLIMFESSKKHYVPNTGATHSQAANITSTDPTDSPSVSPEDLEADKSSASGAQADNTPSKPVQLSKQAIKSEVLSQKSQSETLSQATTDNTTAQDSNTESEKDPTQTVIALAQNQRSADIKGLETGRFDTTEKTPRTHEIKGDQFIIYFKQAEQGYTAEVMEELSKWLAATGKKPVSVTLYTPNIPSVSVSDAMRLAYQRGIILLKTVKKPYPGQEVSISVVNDSSIVNCAIVTVSE
ncbi:hypothetical protein [Dryocola sp. BD626]|uniref:hypothetical protein n=1 Tax=Dryocola sp. BD626 TaxID=3133273 RepID=UPI003F4FF94B